MSDPLQHEPMAEPTPSPAPMTPLAPETPVGSWSDNLDLLKSLFLALVFTALFYEVFPMPFMDEGRLKSMLSNDNWVTPVILGMTVWSLILIAFKAVHFRAERRVWQALRHPSVEPLLSHTIYARDVDKVALALRDALRGLRIKHFATSLVYRRVMRVLAFVRNATKKDGLDALLDYQADIDLQKMESSYTVLQVFIWAIPILGFIGTVLGIGYSVNEFSQFIQTATGGGEFTGQMRAALGGVTSGLAVAFNTTYIGLVFVMPVMLLTSLLHKSEEEFLLNIEEYCLQELLPHIHVKPGEEVLAEGYEDHLHRIMRLSETWLGQFEPLVQRLSRQAEMMSHQLTGIQPLVKEFTDRLLLRGRGTPSEPLAQGGGAAEPPDRDEDPPRTT
ncbi:MAG TPA: MotA/TolQ/ExbB proton channel family protein [bacterium]|nr:MotA/TolQ/ExbB proton channel family protein [bacterium]